MKPSSIDASPVDLLRAELLQRYRRNRSRSRAIFDLLSRDAYYSQPIALRHPIVFYEGHLPGFSFNTLVKKALGGASIDAHLEQLFARGIDPEEDGSERRAFEWPARETVQAFTDEADRRVMAALADADISQSGHPLLGSAQAPLAILEHEEMHQETLLYMLHRLPIEQKVAPAGYRIPTDSEPVASEWVEIPEGHATLGIDRQRVPFAWDNESPAYSVSVPAFTIDRHDVTNARFMEFVEAGGYRDPQWWAPDDWAWLQSDHHRHPGFWEHDGGEWFWRGMFARPPLPLSWPVYVTLAEARAFARWSGARLPTEAEFQRAAFGSPDGERTHPWGDEEPAATHGNFDFRNFDPMPAGRSPAGQSAWGVHDLVGNGWEWTASEFRPFPGFAALPSYPEYSADFFDGLHFVMKGASPVTARELLRPTFRNWFRARYPYMYATFRCVKTR